jgi:putative NIF3 family GTP cyclohydrolase 1 type 2
MTVSAQQVVDHFTSRADWVDAERTVDRVLVGDPDAAHDRCAVTWIPGVAELKETLRRGLRLLVCHEPVFWRHRDEMPEDDPDLCRKRDFILENGMTIVRLHDSWDKWPEVGIPSAWGRFLALGDAPALIHEAGYQHRYDIPPTTLEELAGRVAERCAAIGEPAVQVVGDGAQQISRIGIGTGCIVSLDVYREMGCDCSIVCDDGSCYWSVLQRAADIGHPVIRVNHGTCEEPGMVTLTRYISKHVPGLEAEHIRHGSSFRLVPTPQG